MGPLRHWIDDSRPHSTHTRGAWNDTPRGKPRSSGLPKVGDEELLLISSSSPLAIAAGTGLLLLWWWLGCGPWTDEAEVAEVGGGRGVEGRGEDMGDEADEGDGQEKFNVDEAEWRGTEESEPGADMWCCVEEEDDEGEKVVDVDIDGQKVVA